MTREFLQARSDHGYLIHAVDARGERSGLFGQYIGGRPICGKITGRANGFSTMRLIIPGVSDAATPFTTETVERKLVTQHVCGKCATRVKQATE